MMLWNLEGMQVSGLYMGKFPVSGKVWLSRVKYGGEISHHINLDKSVEIYGTERDSVILNHSEVLQVRNGVVETA
jgi:hypothetical protein